MKYKIVLPISIDGKTYWHGEMVELDAETAKLYSHALQAVTEEKEQNAHNSNS